MQEEDENAVLPRLSQRCGELTTQTPWWPQTQLRWGHKSELQRSRQYSPCRDLKNTKTRGSLWIIFFILFLIRWRWPKLNQIKTESLEWSISWATLRSNYYMICTWFFCIKKLFEISKKKNLKTQLLIHALIQRKPRTAEKQGSWLFNVLWLHQTTARAVMQNIRKDGHSPQ